MSEQLLGNERVIRKLVREGDPLVDRVISWAENVKKTLSGKGEKFTLAQKRRMDKALKLYLKAAEAAGNRDLVKRILALREEDEVIEPLTNKNGSYANENDVSDNVRTTNANNMSVSEGEVKFSRKIEPNMTDAERYEVLKKRSINNIPLVTELSNSVLEKIPEISSWEDINKYLGKDKRNLIQKLTEEFRVFDKEYFNDDIELSFEFSGNNFRESYNKQGHNYVEFAKMFSAFDSVIESAVGVEIHNRTSYKPDPTLDNVFVLMSAYQDGDSIVPVKLEVKKFKDKQNTLYVAISLEKIKRTEVWKQGNTENGVTQNSRSVNISIAKIFEKINPSDKSFIKYIPDGFLNEAQKEAKRQALDAERKAGETKYSRKADQERSTLTKGEAQKQKANYESDKVYTKAEISKMVESLSGLSSIPKRFRTEIVNDIWTAFNSRYSPEQRERHASFLADKIFARVMQESGDAFDNTSQEDLYAMEREIHKALKKIAREGGSPSIFLFKLQFLDSINCTKNGCHTTAVLLYFTSNKAYLHLLPRRRIS